MVSFLKLCESVDQAKSLKGEVGADKILDAIRAGLKYGKRERPHTFWDQIKELARLHAKELEALLQFPRAKISEWPDLIDSAMEYYSQQMGGTLDDKKQMKSVNLQTGDMPPPPAKTNGNAELSNNHKGMTQIASQGNNQKGPT